jgi:hypothetical protein
LRTNLYLSLFVTILPIPPFPPQRRILPEQLVAEHDAANAERLDAIRARWDELITADNESCRCACSGTA